MAEYLAEHWVLSIVATIVLGAIGSGLWDAVKPVSRKLGSTLFTIITFGARRARDKIYREAAMGHHELPSLYILFIVLGLGTAVLIAGQVRLYVAVYAPEVLPPPLIAQCPDKDEVKLKECIRERAKEEVLPALQWLSLIAIFLTVVIFYRFAAVNRMNLVTTYYEQCLKAARPFIDDRNVQLLEQRYAMMTTKEHYDSIISQLADVAKNNGASLPKSYL
jgi:hypothetical protein